MWSRRLVQPSEANKELSDQVFDCLDLDKNGRLQSDDFTGGSEELFKNMLKPLPKKGLDNNDFLSKLVDKIWENGVGSFRRRRDCHLTDTPFPSMLKRLLKGERECSGMTVSPTARLVGPGPDDRPGELQAGRSDSVLTAPKR